MPIQRGSWRTKNTVDAPRSRYRGGRVVPLVATVTPDREKTSRTSAGTPESPYSIHSGPVGLVRTHESAAAGALVGRASPTASPHARQTAVTNVEVRARRCTNGNLDAAR